MRDQFEVAIKKYMPTLREPLARMSECFIVHFVYVLISTWIGLSGGQGYDYFDYSSRDTRIVSLSIRSEVLFRFCTTVITSTVLNSDVTAQEVTFDVTLPDEAFISNFTMEIDGTYYPGVVKEKLAAYKQYRKAKKAGHSAAHIGTRPRNTNKFKVAINVAAETEVTFILTYNELLRRTRGIYEHIVYVNPGEVVDRLLVEVLIKESRDLTTLRVPPVRNDILSNPQITARNPLASIQRLSSTSAYIRYEPTIEHQMSFSPEGISGLFAVEYDIERGYDTGEILIVNGYFVHFFSPTGLAPLPKKVIFILDVSGSMYGRKLEQLRNAMVAILDDLAEDDMFNIILFSSSIDTWKNKLVSVTTGTIAVAKKFINRMKVKGWTNINDALIEGLSFILSDYEKHAPLVVFLTDGIPTFGEMKTKNILSNIRTTNNASIPIFTLAFGVSADFDFLKKLSTQNNAFSRKIYEASDATLQITGLYDEISSILMSNITFFYLNNSVDKTVLTRTNFPNLFSGSELVISGKLLDNSISTLPVNVVGEASSGDVILSSVTGIRMGSDFEYIPEFQTSMDFKEITEKLWAYLTIKQLIRQRLGEEDVVQRDILKNRTIETALQYNFVTPFTSMVVTKPESGDKTKEETAFQDDDFRRKSRRNQLRHYNQKAPLRVFSSANQYASFADNDPHFIIRIRGLEYSVCFDIMGLPRDVFQLVRDDIADVRVNAQIVGDGQNSHSRKQRRHKRNRKRFRMKETSKTYLGKVIVFRKNFNITLTPDKMKINGQPLPWRNDTAVIINRNRVVTDGTGNMVALLFPNKITLLVVRHMRTRAQSRAGKVDYLGFYIVNEKGFSNQAHGLLGQFLFRYISVDKLKMKNGRQTGRLNVRGNTKRPRRVMSSLGKRLNMATNTSVTCWMVQRNGRGLLDGSYKSYILRGPSVSD